MKKIKDHFTLLGHLKVKGKLSKIKIKKQKDFICTFCGTKKKQGDKSSCPNCGRYNFEFPQKLIKTSIKGGTYGKMGINPLAYKEFYRCSTSHLRAILDTQNHIDYQTKVTINNILIKREWRTLWKTSKKDLPLLINFSWHSEQIKSLYKKRLERGV